MQEGQKPCHALLFHIIRVPSVPLGCFHARYQQAPCVDRGFDRSITYFPLVCLSPDASGLWPESAESTPSVPLARYSFEAPCPPVCWEWWLLSSSVRKMGDGTRRTLQ